MECFAEPVQITNALHSIIPLIFEGIPHSRMQIHSFFRNSCAFLSFLMFGISRLWKCQNRTHLTHRIFLPRTASTMSAAPTTFDSLSLNPKTLQSLTTEFRYSEMSEVQERVLRDGSVAGGKDLLVRAKYYQSNSGRERGKLWPSCWRLSSTVWPRTHSRTKRSQFSSYHQLANSLHKLLPKPLSSFAFIV